MGIILIAKPLVALLIVRLLGYSVRTAITVAVSGSTHEIYLPVTTALRRFEPDALKSPLEELIVRLAVGTSPAVSRASRRCRDKCRTRR